MARGSTIPTQKEHGYLPLGDEGVHITVRDHMIRLALRDAKRPDVMAIAAQIKGACAHLRGEAKDYCQVYSAFKAVVDNVRYVNDPDGIEFVQAPSTLLVRTHEGDCDCQATSLASILTALGYLNIIKVIDWKREGYSHVYNEVYLPSKNITIPLDTVFRIPWNPYYGFGREKAPIIRSYRYGVNMQRPAA